MLSQGENGVEISFILKESQNFSWVVLIYKIGYINIRFFRFDKKVYFFYIYIKTFCIIERLKFNHMESNATFL